MENELIQIDFARVFQLLDFVRLLLLLLAFGQLDVELHVLRRAIVRYVIKGLKVHPRNVFRNVDFVASDVAPY
jgi:hypothetical protein